MEKGKLEYNGILGKCFLNGREVKFGEDYLFFTVKEGDGLIVDYEARIFKVDDGFLIEGIIELESIDGIPAKRVIKR